VKTALKTPRKPHIDQPVCSTTNRSVITGIAEDADHPLIVKISTPEGCRFSKRPGLSCRTCTLSPSTPQSPWDSSLAMWWRFEL
jgi:hypothetical protein